MLLAPFAERCDGGMVVLLLLFAAPPLHKHTHLWLLGSLLSKRTDDTDTTRVDCSDLPAAPGDLL